MHACILEFYIKFMCWSCARCIIASAAVEHVWYFKFTHSDVLCGFGRGRCGSHLGDCANMHFILHSYPSIVGTVMSPKLRGLGRGRCGLQSGGCKFLLCVGFGFGWQI